MFIIDLKYCVDYNDHHRYVMLTSILANLNEMSLNEVECTVSMFLAHRFALVINGVPIERLLRMNTKPLYALSVILWYLLVKEVVKNVPTQQLHLPSIIYSPLFCPHPGTGLRLAHSVRDITDACFYNNELLGSSNSGMEIIVEEIKLRA